MRGYRFASLLLAVLPMVGCARKAPGPDECVPFAEALFGATHEEVLEYPVLKQKFDAVVTACLTTPFDRRVFTCTAATRSPLRCLQQYEPSLKSTPQPGDAFMDKPRRHPQRREY